jgi:disulfide oxidoreductase YuzD
MHMNLQVDDLDYPVIVINDGRVFEKNLQSWEV